MIGRLLSWGHEVEIVVSGNAHKFLRDRFEGVRQIWGLSILMEDHKVQKFDTARKFIKGALTGWPENVQQYLTMTDEFEPEVVISDFESWSALYGYSHRLPVICLDNIQAVRRLWHAPEILRGHTADWRMTKGIIKAKIPTADHYLITSFFDAQPRKSRTSVVPPILRPSLLEAKPVEGDHILVYQTGATFASLPKVLQGFENIHFKIYGLRKDLTEEQTEGNLTFCPFGEETFVHDLATCKGVIASAGFTLIGEALHLGKPYLATPVGGQFEQVMNARYIEHLGYGLQDEDLDEFSIQAFLNHLDDFREALADYPRHDNEAMFSALEAQLDIAAADL